MWTMEKTASAESPRRSASVAELISNLTEQQMRLMETYKTFLDSMRLESNLHETEEKLSNLRKAGSKLISLQKEHMIKMLLMLYPIFRVVMSQTQFEEDACIQMLGDKTRLQSYDLVELSCILRCYFAKLAIYVYHLASFVNDRATYESMIPEDPNLKLQQDVISHMNKSDGVFHTPTAGFIPQKEMVHKTFDTRRSTDSTPSGTPDRRSHRQPSTPSGISYGVAGDVCHNHVESVNHSIPVQYDVTTTDQRYKEFEPDDGSTDLHRITMRNGQPAVHSCGEGVSIRSKSSSSSRFKGGNVGMFRDSNAYYDLQPTGKDETDNGAEYLESNDIYSGQKVQMESTVDGVPFVLGNAQQSPGYGMTQLRGHTKEPDAVSWYTTGGDNGIRFTADNYQPLRNDISVTAGVNMPQTQRIQDSNTEDVVGALQRGSHTRTIMQAGRSVYPVEHLAVNGSKNRSVSMSYRCDTPGNRSVQSDVSDVLLLDYRETERPSQSNMWMGMRDVRSPVKNHGVPYNGRKQSPYFAGMCCGDDGVTRTKYVQKDSPEFVPDVYHPSFYLNKQQICRQVHVKGNDDSGMHMTYLFYDKPIHDTQRERSKRGDDEEEVANHAEELQSNDHMSVVDNDAAARNDLQTRSVRSDGPCPQQSDVSAQVEGLDVGSNHHHVAQRIENYQNFLGSKEYVESVTEYVLEDPGVSSITSNVNGVTEGQSSLMGYAHVNVMESSQKATSAKVNGGNVVPEDEAEVGVLHRSIGDVQDHLCLQVQLSQEDVLADQIVESSDRDCFSGESDMIVRPEVSERPTVDERYIHNSSTTTPCIITAQKSDFKPTESVQEANSSWKLSERDENSVLLNQQPSGITTQHNLAQRFMDDVTPKDIAKTTDTSCVTEKASKAITCEMPCSSPQNSEDDILSSSRIRIPLIDMSKLVINPSS